MISCKSCQEYDICPCGREGHDNGTSVGDSIGECSSYKERYSFQEAKDRLSVLKCTDGFMPGDHEAMRVGIDAIEKIEKILPLLDTDMDNELALERIREVVYNDLHISNKTGKENL